MLEIRSLSAGYSEKQILQDLSLTVGEGTLTVILGPNGSGKSTLLKAVTGLLPSSGEILLQDTDIRILPSRERAKKIAFLPQSRPVPEITAGKLVLHGRFPWLGYPRYYREADRQAAREAMVQLGISGLEHRSMPSLSGGERQKVYVAMLLAQQTPLILMDEPTAYLDIAHKFGLMELARQLTRQGKTVLMVLHDLDLAMRYADRVAVMDNGRVPLCAAPEEIFRSGILERVFRICMRRVQTPDGMQYYCLPEKL